jgi:hypothetical protein
MTATFAALLLAHALADFVLQTGWMAQGKADRAPLPLIAHGAVVGATAALATGTLGWPIALVAALHLTIDIAKSFAPRDRLWPFLADQAAHLATLGVVAALVPDLFSGGLWAGADALPGLMAFAAGLILTTRAGGFAIGLLMAPWADVSLPRGLPDGGRLIGLLERGLIFLFVLVGQPGGIGFLIAAKSVLRFDTAREDQRAGEYVIIGTLASFGWGLAASYATLMLMDALPPLGIARAGP